MPQDASRDVSLKDPPPPGYQLYTGAGDPVPESSPVKNQLFQLVCEHYKFVPIRVGASYDGFYDRLDRSLPFQSYPRNWDSLECEQVACVVDSVKFVGTDQIWSKEQRDAWLKEPLYHEWKWRPYADVFASCDRSAYTANDSVYGSTKAALEYLVTSVHPRF